MSVDTQIEQLRALFQQCSIANVAIIDDAYYTSPPLSWFTAESLGQLKANIDALDEPPEQIEELRSTLSEPSDLTADVIKSIYALKETSPEIAKWFRDYDNEIARKRKPLITLRKVLMDELGCTVTTLSPQEDLPETLNPHLIFVDYFLDAQSREADSLQLAEEIGEKLKQNLADMDKPLVILMSNQDVSPAMKTQFRERANLLGGLFYFIPKGEIERTVALVIKLAILVKSLDDGRRIQTFVEAFEQEISGPTGASAKFLRKVKSLTLEDYAYMQKLSLQGEGMPMGDYLLWLFGTYLGYLVFHAIPTNRKQLDSLAFDSIPEAENSPSSEFIDLYRNVVAGETEDLASHPQATENDPQAPPDLHFGDLFFNDSGEVRMIATAECDLMVTPRDQRGRPFDPDRSIFVVPGHALEMDSSVSAGDVTHFVPMDDKTVSISWKPKKTYTERWDAIRGSLSQNGFQRRARLRYPFSNQVQQGFIGNLVRVGIPVAPPLLRTRKVVIYWQADTARANVEVANGATTYKDRANTEYVRLKLPCVVKIIDRANELLTVTRQKLSDEEAGRGSGSETPTEKRLTSRIQQLEKLVGTLDSSSDLRDHFAVRPGKSIEIPGLPVVLCRDQSQIDSQLSRRPIVVFVSGDHDSESESETAASLQA